ncbi:MAG: OadG family protein [Bacteroidales bacterium]
MENLNTALMLLGVGMGTVFFILLFIIYFSKGLILFINKFFPEVILQKSNATDPANLRPDDIPQQVTTIIQKAVKSAIKGVKITNITKIK